MEREKGSHCVVGDMMGEKMGEKKFWGRRNVENVSIIRGVGWRGGGQEYCLKMKREKSVVSFPLSRK